MKSFIKPTSTFGRVLVPLVSLTAAGAVIAGSGATFTSTSSNDKIASVVASGTLEQTNSAADQAIFNLANIKPGDVVNGTLTISNTGTLPATFSLTEVSSTNTFAANYLTLTITDTATKANVYEGTFGGLTDGEQNELGIFGAGDAHTYTFTVRFDENAPNSERNKKATATYRWDAVQLVGETTNQVDGRGVA